MIYKKYKLAWATAATLILAVQLSCAAQIESADLVDMTRLTPAALGERLAAMEERVLGLEHPLDSLMDRTSALESSIFGGSPPSGDTALPERIGSLEAAVFKNAAKPTEALPDGMSTFVGAKNLSLNGIPHVVASPVPEGLDRPTPDTSAPPNLVPVANNPSVLSNTPPPSVVRPPSPPAAPNLVNPYAVPGRYAGYPFVYRGPGLAPSAYGAYPGTSTWFNSAYRQSGQVFYTSSPYFPYAANRSSNRATH